MRSEKARNIASAQGSGFSVQAAVPVKEVLQVPLPDLGLQAQYCSLQTNPLDDPMLLT
jgi:hypothetical protein